MEIPIVHRRAARRLFSLNAFIWGVGNGLLSTALIVYLIRDICRGEPEAAVGTTVAWLIAAPRIAGLLRLLVPVLIDRCSRRKNFCTAMYLLSACVLATIPRLMPDLVPGSLESGDTGRILFFLVLVWCLYHLCEYMGMVALYAWMADLVPERFRGRFLGVREACLIAGQMLGFLTAGLYTYWTVETMTQDVPAFPRWHAYLLPTWYGVGFFLAAVLPLLFVPEIPWRRGEQGLRKRLRQLIEPLSLPGFLPLLLFGCWLQAAIGLTQSAQYRFQIYVLGVSMLVSLGREGTTRLGQFFLGPTMGRWIDRFGAAPTVSLTLALAASGSLFYFIAEKESWWLVFGAAGCWIFWVGVNIGLSSTVLAIASSESRSSALALYYTATTLSLALFTLLGGALDDRLRDVCLAWWPGAEPITYQRLSFLIGFTLRLAAIPLFLWAVRRSATGWKTGSKRPSRPNQ